MTWKLRETATIDISPRRRMNTNLKRAVNAVGDVYRGVGGRVNMNESTQAIRQ
jgi:hypothetical protein